MFRLTLVLVIVLSLLHCASPRAKAGDRPPRNEIGDCAKNLARSGSQQGHDDPTEKTRATDPSHEKYEAVPLAAYEAALRALEALNAEAKPLLDADPGANIGNQTLLIKALRDRANEVLSASEYPSNDQRGGKQKTAEVPQIVLTAFELARKLEFLQSQLSPRRLGSTWLQTIVPIDTPRSVLYEETDVSDTPSPVRRIEILAAKELLLYRGQQLVSTLYGAIYLLNYKEGDDRARQTIAELDRKRLEFHKVDVPPKPTSQIAKKMRITALSKALWEEIPEPSEREVQVLLISDSVRTTIPLAAATASVSRSKAVTKEKRAQNFPDFFWNFVEEPLPH